MTTLNKHPIHILIAEDEKTDVLFIKSAFDKIGTDTELDIVENGKQLLAFLKKEPPYQDAKEPNLILLDINMPCMNGHEALEIIKKDQTLKHIPVIMLSGSNATNDILKSYDNYANAYMPKSSGLAEVRDFVRTLKECWLDRTNLPQS